MPLLILCACALAVALAAVALLGYRARRLEAELRRAAEGDDDVRRDERLFRSLVEHSSDLILLVDTTGTIRYASASARGAIVRRAEPLVGVKMSALAHPDDRLKLRGLLAESLENPVETPSIDLRVQRGSEFHWAHVEAIAANRLDDPGVAGIVVSLRDITRRKWAEEAMRAAEMKYRTLVEQLPLVTYVDNLDDTSSAHYMSPQIESLLGYSTDEWLADRDLFPKLLHPDDRDRVMAEIARSHETYEPFTAEYRLVARDGRVVWFRDQAVTIRDENGRPLFAHGFLLDITDEREGSNRESEGGERRLRRAG